MYLNPSTRKEDEENDDNDGQRRLMALSYSAAPVPVDGARTLPSIRELLPDHVGGSSDSARYAPHYNAARTSAATSQWSTEGSPSLMNSGLQSPGFSPHPIPNERAGSHRSPPLRQSGHDRPTSHHGSPDAGGSLEPRRTLPPIRDLQARGNELMSHSSVYERRQDADPRYPTSPALHSVPGAATSRPPGAEQSRAYPASATSSPYASPQRRPYTTEPEYMPTHLVSAINPQSGTATGESGDSRTRRRRGNLPKAVTDVLRQWIAEHLDNPYPSDEDKQMLIAHTGLTSSQLSNWLINARRRTVPALRQARAAEPGSSARDESPWSDPDETSSLASDTNR